MRWHLVSDRTWPAAHMPWDEPAEIDLQWHEEILPRQKTLALPDHVWLRPKAAEHDASTSSTTSLQLHRWLRYIIRRILRHRPSQVVEMDPTGHLIVP